MIIKVKQEKDDNNRTSENLKQLEFIRNVRSFPIKFGQKIRRTTSIPSLSSENITKLSNNETFSYDINFAISGFIIFASVLTLLIIMYIIVAIRLVSIKREIFKQRRHGLTKSTLLTSSNSLKRYFVLISVKIKKSFFENQ